MRLEQSFWSWHQSSRCAIGDSASTVTDAPSRRKCRRVAYDQVTKAAVLSAVKNARDLDMDLVDAQKARQVLDRLIGYKISPVVWYAVGKGTSAGRVQSIALKLICDRQKEIDAFKPVTYWHVDALLGCKDGEYWTQHIIVKGKHIVIKINDNIVVDHTEPKDKQAFSKVFERRLGSGTFAFQAHDPNSKVYFKNIRVKRLP